MRPAIVPATRELLERYYGHSQSRSVRALAVVLDGEPICIGGTCRDGARVIAFAEIKPVMRERYRKTGLLLAKRVMAMIRETGVPVFTITDCNVEAAERFLEHLGFTKRAEGIYTWPP